MKDLVNKPEHYNQHKIECIEFTRYMDFNTGNAFKYLWRCGLKDEPKQELRKAIWYLKDSLKHNLDYLIPRELNFPVLFITDHKYGAVMARILSFHRTKELVYLEFALAWLTEELNGLN